jgi:hypothetical protein
LRIEARTLDDIRALGVNDPEDDKRFATVARVSEINKGLYETFVAPALRMTVTESMAELTRAAHPGRLRFAMFSDRNPAMQPVSAIAEAVRKARQPVSPANPLLAMEHAASSWMSTWLQALGDWRDAMTEALFLTTYGSPWLQALVGLAQQPPARSERDLVREARIARLRAELEGRFEAGGLEEAALRSLVYIRLPERSIDERGFAMLKLISASRSADQRMGLARFKEVLREQYLLVCLDEERAISALPVLLQRHEARAKSVLDNLRKVLAASGTMSAETKRRLSRVEQVFGARRAKATVGNHIDA